MQTQVLSDLSQKAAADAMTAISRVAELGESDFERMGIVTASTSMLLIAIVDALELNEADYRALCDTVWHLTKLKREARKAKAER